MTASQLEVHVESVGGSHGHQSHGGFSWDERDEFTVHFLFTVNIDVYGM